ncbi:hypothetical protein [Zhaonella formicivorans]|nr:hypothetical protein [Zhaonella formicivorans]
MRLKVTEPFEIPNRTEHPEIAPPEIPFENQPLKLPSKQDSAGYR